MQPDLIVEIFERLDIDAESSDAWNNAGTAIQHFVNFITRLKKIEHRISKDHRILCLAEIFFENIDETILA